MKLVYDNSATVRDGYASDDSVEFGLQKAEARLRAVKSGRGSLVVKVLDRGWHVIEFDPSTSKDPLCRERCTLNLSRAQTSSRWCGVVVRRGGVSSGVVLVS
ncbi:UNVERIFIED_CONTAM: hypothetical protein NCL1_11868 [Trichonephila clavipes]